MEQTRCLRTATLVVCRDRLPAAAGWLPHVMRCIDDYLAGSLSHEALTAACEAGASEHTLEYILRNTAPVWKEAVKAAGRGGHMHVLRWVTGREDGRGPWKADFDYTLELAATHGHLALVKWLFERGIDSHTLQKTQKDSKGYIEKCWLYEHCTAAALNLAAEHGYLEVVKWIYGARTDTCSIDCSPMNKAVAKGHLTIAQWLHSVKAEGCSAGAIDEAAKNGHLEVLQWLDANHRFTCTPATMYQAAGNGHLEVVKWLHRAHHECCSYEAMGQAASNGHLEVAEWLYDNVYRKCQSSVVFMDALHPAGAGRLDALKWMHERFQTHGWHAMDAAATNGHMDVVTWLYENCNEGCTSFAAFSAARNGHLDVLKWLYTHYPDTLEPGLYDRIGRAAGNGHLDVVRWLHENRLERGQNDAMYSATTNGHLDIFLYLLEHRTEGFSRVVFLDAQDIEVLCHFNLDDSGDRRSNRATSDQLKMLQTLFERRPAFVQDCLRDLAYIACTRGNIAMMDWVMPFGIKLNSTEPICDAVFRGDVKMLQWFFENGFEITDPDLVKVAVQRSRLEVLRWLWGHGYDVDSLELVKIAAINDIPTMRWLVEHGPPLDLSTATTLVIEYRYIEIAWWIAEDARKDLVLEALHRNDLEVVWWILAHTQFQDESAQGSIRDAIRCSNGVQQWFEENMIEVEACRWCFPMVTKRQIEESGETDLSSTKRKRSGEMLV
ncbi:hypothetical protein PR003_g12234 [Phytophthora rubi]|uniref:Uncharacterized protein n=1 Tax=Phytophthora rubi TaxID=129364 RepID=A0A6A3LMP5_9STRA|nr:hypothetical protein PR001_g13507 [Phytophthora rubi]KAE9023818.1 hypothetical protein PR002_g11614 [Phytophthora rubi]KAE9336973.1 hypothetical protein PR003_g12234 [Phytophthora rubi]